MTPGTYRLTKLGKGRGAGPPSFRASAHLEHLELRPDGTCHHSGITGQRDGTWRREGAGLVLELPVGTRRGLATEVGFDLRVEDEEHGGWLLERYEREAAPLDVAAALARLEKARDPARLIEREHLLPWALRLGAAELLAACLERGAAVYPSTLLRLGETPAAAREAVLAQVAAHPNALPHLPAYLGREAPPAVAQALLALASALATPALLALLSGTYCPPRDEVFRLLLDAGADLGAVDGAVPLALRLAVLAPPAWVRRLPPGDATALAAPATLVLDWGTVSLPAGATPQGAVAACLAALGARLGPSSPPWMAAARDRLQETAALLA